MKSVQPHCAQDNDYIRVVNAMSMVSSVLWLSALFLFVHGLTGKMMGVKTTPLQVSGDDEERVESQRSLLRSCDVSQTTSLWTCNVFTSILYSIQKKVYEYSDPFHFFQSLANVCIVPPCPASWVATQKHTLSAAHYDSVGRNTVMMGRCTSLL